MYVQLFLHSIVQGLKRIIYNRKTIYILYTISKVFDFERCNWLKTIIIIKRFEKFPLGTLTFLKYF